MSEYFIPLSTLVPSAPSWPLLSHLVPRWDDLVRKVGVRHYDETWSDHAVVIRGQVVVDVGAALRFGGFSLLCGSGGDGEQLVFDFECTSDRTSLFQSLVAAALEFVPDPTGPHDPVQVLLDDGVLDPENPVLLVDAPVSSFRLTVHGIAARLRLPEDEVELGERVLDAAGDVIGIRTAISAEPVEILLPSFTLVFDLEQGIDLLLDDTVLDVPAFIHKETGTGWELRRARIETRPARRSAEAADGLSTVGSLGQGDAWLGLAIEEARIFKLDELVGFLPQKIEVRDFLYGGEGLSGRFELAWEEPRDDRRWWLSRLEAEWDRGDFLGFGAEAAFRMSRLAPETWLAELGDLAFAASGRHNPEAGLAWEIACRRPPQGDQGLFTLGNDFLETSQILLFPFLFGLLAYQSTPASGLAAVGLVVATALQGDGKLTLERITCDRIALRIQPREVDGRTVRFLEAVTDWRLAVSLDFGGLWGIFPSFKTEKPLLVGIRGLVIRSAFGAPSELGLPPVSLALDHQSGVSFEVSEQAIVDLGYLCRLTRLEAGEWEEGIWVEAGLEKDPGRIDIGLGVASVRLWFRQNGDYVKTTFGDPAFTLLVPQVLYAKGSMDLGEVDRFAVRAFACGTGRARTLAEHQARESYLWDLDVDILSGQGSFVISGSLEYSSGVPFLGSSSLYGLSLLYLDDAQPAVEGRDLSWWYLEKAPPHELTAAKFEPGGADWGFGVGLIVGSTAGSGRFWSVKAGLLVMAGPRIAAFGTLGFMQDRSALGSGTGGTVGLVIDLDFQRDIHRFSLDFRLERPEGGSVLLIHVPGEMLISEPRFYLYVGRDRPLARQARLRLFDTVDLSGYLMLDSSDLVNLAGRDASVPGFAIALGGAGAWEIGYRGGRLKCYFALELAFDVAAHLCPPRTIFGSVFFKGGLVVKFYIGLELHVEIDGYFLSGGTQRRMQGDFALTINLPWPLPDLRASIPITCGDPEVELEDPVLAVDRLTLMPRGRNETREIRPGESLLDVPLDPTFSLGFLFSVRSGEEVSGPFTVHAPDGETWNVVAGDGRRGRVGYRFTLTGLRLQKLWRLEWVDVPGPFPAKWAERPAATRAPGGSPLRNALDLFEYEGSLMTRLMGPAARYTDLVLEGWDPCPEPAPAVEVCYGFDAEPLGWLGDERVLQGAGDDPEVMLRPQPATDAAGIARRYYGLQVVPPFVVPAPVPLPGIPAARALRLPLVVGSAASFEALDSAGIAPARGLEIALPPARVVTLEVLRGAGAEVRARFFRGDVPVAAREEGAPAGSTGDRVHVRFSATGTIDRVVLEARFSILDPGQAVEEAWLYRICALFWAGVTAAEQAEATGRQWHRFWSDLLNQQAGAWDDFLLAPGASYRLLVDLEWGLLRTEPQEEVRTGTQQAVFHFQTAAEPPAALRGRETSLGGGEDDWDVQIMPGPEAPHYLERPLGLIFRDSRLPSIFRAFGRRLVLRLVDAAGHDVFASLTALAARAPELPEYRRIWADRIARSPCAPPGVDGLFDWGVAVFGSVLAPDTWYDARVVSVADPAGDLDLANLPPGFDWNAQPVLYQSRFKTSRYGSLAEHLAGYADLDEVAEGTPDLAALVAEAGTSAGLVVDDRQVDRAFVHLRLPPRNPPGPQWPPPELVRVWQAEAGGHRLVALLLDSPEPLLREGDALRILTGTGTELPLLHLRSVAGTRSVVLFAGGGGAPEPGPLRIEVAGDFRGPAGLLVPELATRDLAPRDAPLFVTAEED